MKPALQSHASRLTLPSYSTRNTLRVRKWNSGKARKRNKCELTDEKTNLSVRHKPIVLSDQMHALQSRRSRRIRRKSRRIRRTSRRRRRRRRRRKRRKWWWLWRWWRVKTRLKCWHLIISHMQVESVWFTLLIFFVKITKGTGLMNVFPRHKFTLFTWGHSFHCKPLLKKLS